MDSSKRVALALVSAALILFVWNTWIQPPPPRPVRPPTADTTAAAPATAGSAAAPLPGVPAESPAAAAAASARTVAVRSPLYEYRFSTRGAGLAQAELLKFPSYVEKGKSVQLVPRGAGTVLSYRLVTGGAALDLRQADCAPSTDALTLGQGANGGNELRFTCALAGRPVAEIAYTFRPDSYLVDIRGRFVGTGASGTLLADLGTGLAAHDAREHATERELSFVGWNGGRTERLYLRRVAESDTIPGGLAWAGVRDRYFLMALLNQGGRQFTRLVATDAPDESYRVGNETRVAPRARAEVALPLGADGAFAFQAYLGPLAHDQLEAAGHQLEEVNPYGYRWLRPVIRPIAAAVLWVLKELHELGISYGLVLVIFGFMMRLVTWPLNAKAMRAQMKNMAVQPQLQARMKEVQERWGSDPRKQQEEMLKVYGELGVNPLSMLSGCFPMLIPMPVLITLFFVFQGAIEFRGTSFAWLPDLSLRDPYHILPVFLIGSMFALQWVSTRMSGMEQNAQTKTMMYTMPLMMGMFFWWMPSGLNLYYATTNLASLPQQILIARERRKAMDEQKAKDAAKSKPPRAGIARTSGGPRRKQ
jgi:YidC/Oxa1 family membrane protein insertase